MESPFEKLDGVNEVISGYTGGHKLNPTYQDVSAGGTGHAEAVKVLYNPQQISYEKLLDVCWRQINPTDGGGQFVDRGEQYRSEIFYLNDEQRQLAEASEKQLAAAGKFDKPIVTAITPAGVFYPAEEYHQDYYSKNPIRYWYYRGGSGRDDFLENVWGKSH
jgi:methionine-S-sulfoxide reductase